MCPKKKRHWLWNIAIVATSIICLLAFALHYKNWTTLEKDNLTIVSGIYYKKMPFAEIDSIKMVKKIPSMERISGFSAMEKEKGVFKDSIKHTKVYVYVDNLYHPKIRLVYKDSLKLYLNFSDSTKTQKLYELLLHKRDSLKN